VHHNFEFIYEVNTHALLSLKKSVAAKQDESADASARVAADVDCLVWTVVEAGQVDVAQQTASLEVNRFEVVFRVEPDFTEVAHADVETVVRHAVDRMAPTRHTDGCLLLLGVGYENLHVILVFRPCDGCRLPDDTCVPVFYWLAKGFHFFSYPFFTKSELFIFLGSFQMYFAFKVI